jgi:hypothetical protein
MTLTEDQNGGDYEAHQYLLPLNHLFDQLDPKVLEHLHGTPPLRFTRFMWQVQSQFADKRKLELASDEDREFWNLCLYGKWLDPLMAILAAYQIVRYGEGQVSLSVVLHNLRQYFTGIPDVEVIATLAGEQSHPTPTSPLVLDGYHHWRKSGETPPLPESRLSYTGPWTAWYGVPKG